MNIIHTPGFVGLIVVGYKTLKSIGWRDWMEKGGCGGLQGLVYEVVG